MRYLDSPVRLRKFADDGAALRGIVALGHRHVLQFRVIDGRRIVRCVVAPFVGGMVDIVREISGLCGFDARLMLKRAIVPDVVTGCRGMGVNRAFGSAVRSR